MPGTDYPKILKNAIKSTFFEAYNNEPDGIYPELVTVVESGRGRMSETYGFLGNNPAVREWLDERTSGRPDEYEYVIKNRKWESTLEIKREDVDADQYGQIRLRVQQLAWAARRHKEKLVIQTLVDGTTGLCYDGQPFFSANHSSGKSGTQSNSVTAAFSVSALQAAIIAMMNFKDDQGEPLGIVPDTILVPPALMWTVREVLESPVVVIKGGSNTYTDYKNVMAGSLRLLVSPYITSSTAWYLLRLNHPLRPLILQQSDPLEFVALEEPGSSADVFWRDRYLYGIRERYNVGYGPWFTAYYSSGTS